MVTAVLWDQIEAPPLRERPDLADRIRASVPELPCGSLPDTPAELRTAIGAARAELAEHPESLMSSDETIASLRDEFGL